MHIPFITDTGLLEAFEKHGTMQEFEPVQAIIEPGQYIIKMFLSSWGLLK